MISFEHVSFSYDGATPALRDVDLLIGRGEFVCILGGNGSGKTTLAKHLNALLLPDEGQVLIDGRDTRDGSDTRDGNARGTHDAEALYAIRSKVGMVFQNPDDQLLASLVENDVAFGPENLALPAQELRSRVTRSLEQVGLEGFERRETHTLSGGQKQRVAIAGVLAMEPQILVLDEASAMLDPRGRANLMHVCRSLHARGMTIVAITHVVEEATQAGRVVVLEEGRVALDGTPEEVLVRVEELERLNLELPFAVRISLLLRAQGIPVKVHIRPRELKEDLCRLRRSPARRDPARRSHVD